jgi:hypothetical protein
MQSTEEIAARIGAGVNNVPTVTPEEWAARMAEKAARIEQYGSIEAWAAAGGGNVLGGGDTATCSVCGATMQAGELAAHMASRHSGGGGGTVEELADKKAHWIEMAQETADAMLAIEQAAADKRAAKIDQWNKAAQQHWRPEGSGADRHLFTTGKGPCLATLKDYGDIDFRIDYRISPKGDSGIYLRNVPQVQIWDKNQVFDPTKPTRRPQLGSGGLFNNTPDTPGRDPLVLADKDFGEWNSFRIRQIGAVTWVWLNDKLVVDGAVMENFYVRSKPLDA